MPTGTLQVKVTTGDGAVPVSEATVRVRDALGGIAFVLSTDMNGMTTVISLFAPSRKFSMSPHTSHLAYSAYEVLVTHSGFVPQVIRGVRVFEGEGGLLPIDLVARTARTDLGDSVNVIDIPPLGASEPMNFQTPGASMPMNFPPSGMPMPMNFPPPGMSPGR